MICDILDDNTSPYIPFHTPRCRHVIEAALFGQDPPTPQPPQRARSSPTLAKSAGKCCLISTLLPSYACIFVEPSSLPSVPATGGPYYF